MYIGNLGDFFYKDKYWLLNQPKITKENKFQFIKTGGKIFKLNIYTGVLYEMKINTNKHLYKSSLSSIKNIKTQNIKKCKGSTKNININIKSLNKNKNEKNIISPKIKNRLNRTLEKKEKNKLNIKRNKSSNTNTNFSLTSRNYYNNKTEKLYNLYLNKKYIFNKIKKRNENRNNLEKNNFFTLDVNNNKRTRNKFYNFPPLNIKKTFDYEKNNDIDSDEFFQEDICEIKKEDNRIITQVKNQLFKDKMFNILQKKYNFYKEDKNSIINIPKLNLDSARIFYVNKRKSPIKKLLSKTTRNKFKIFYKNKTSY